MSISSVYLPKKPFDSGSIMVSSEIIEEYFRKNGMNVSCHIDSDPKLDILSLILRPKLFFRLTITRGMMEESDVETITNIFNESVENMKRYYLGSILSLNNNCSIPSEYIDKYCIVYNPNKVDLVMLNAILVALEL